ncbi:hypothetical protein [Yaniella flava]
MSKESVDGDQISDEQIQRWADEAEAGYEVEELRRCGRPAVA